MIQTTRHIPTDPLYLRAEAGDTKIPEPIITARMRLMAEKSPSSLFSPTAAPSVTIFYILKNILSAEK